MNHCFSRRLKYFDHEDGDMAIVDLLKDKCTSGAVYTLWLIPTGITVILLKKYWCIKAPHGSTSGLNCLLEACDCYMLNEYNICFTVQ